MTKTGADLVKHLGELAFATRLKRLAELLQADVAQIYRELHVDFEPKWFTMLYALHHNGTMSVLELSNLLGLTHPAIIQFAEQMQRKKLVSTVRDKNDARKKLIQLTEKGKATFAGIEPVLREIELANRDLMLETGSNVLVTIEKMEHLLQKRSMYQRIKDRMNASFREQIEIITYSPKLKQAFKKLNEEWLTKYFTIEKADEKILDNPTSEIIAHNGEIFFAKTDNEIIGTCAIRQNTPGTYELLKMAVTEEYQSRGVGRMLTQEAIAYAKKKKAKTIELDTSRKLNSAMSLYERLGFTISNEKPNENYERCTVKMKLDLKAVFLGVVAISSMALWCWWISRLSQSDSAEVAWHSYLLPKISWIGALIDFWLRVMI
ncbi:MAG: GNAT family N-acetyltransferase [Chitinophagales bacterium]|nr:GNAT family N-acetyltransferase [Chitinophagales bacterium]